MPEIALKTTRQPGFSDEGRVESKEYRNSRNYIQTTVRDRNHSATPEWDIKSYSVGVKF